MGPGNKRQAVVVVESLRDVLTECVTGTTGRDSPSAPVVGVRPQKVAHGSLVGHLLDPVKGADVVERVDAGRQASVQAEDLVVDEGCEGQVVEEIGEVLPHVCVAVFPEALVVEAVDLGDLARLVVAAEDSDAPGVADLQGDQQGDCLNRVISSVDVVA